MDNRSAIWIGLTILAILALDYLWLNWGIPLWSMQKLAEISDYVAFWR